MSRSRDVHQHEGRDEDDVGLLELLASRGVDVGDAGRLARVIDLDLVDIAIGANLVLAGGQRRRHVDDERVRLGGHLATVAGAETTVDARAAGVSGQVLVALGEDPDGCGKG